MVFFQVLFSIYGDLWIGTALKKYVAETYENRFDLGYSDLAVKFIFGDIELRNFYLSEQIAENRRGENYIYLKSFTMEGFGFMRFLYDRSLTWKSLKSENPVVKLDLRGETANYSQKDFQRFFLESGEFTLKDALVEVISDRYRLKLNEVNCFFSNLNIKANTTDGISKKSGVDAISLNGKGVLVYGSDTVNLDLGNFYFNDTENYLSISDLKVNHSVNQDFLKGQLKFFKLTEFEHENLLKLGKLSCEKIIVDKLNIKGNRSYLDMLFQLFLEPHPTQKNTNIIDFNALELSNTALEFYDANTNKELYFSAPILNIDELRNSLSNVEKHPNINILIDTVFIPINQRSYASSGEIKVNSSTSSLNVESLFFKDDLLKLQIPKLHGIASSFSKFVEGEIDLKELELRNPIIDITHKDVRSRGRDSTSKLPFQFKVRAFDVIDGKFELDRGKEQFSFQYNTQLKDIVISSLDDIVFKEVDLHLDDLKHTLSETKYLVTKSVRYHTDRGVELPKFKFILDEETDSYFTFDSLATKVVVSDDGKLVELEDTFLDQLQLKLKVGSSKKKDSAFPMSFSFKNFNISQSVLDIEFLEDSTRQVNSDLQIHNLDFKTPFFTYVNGQFNGDFDLEFAEMNYEHFDKHIKVRTQNAMFSSEFSMLNEVFVEYQSSESGIHGSARVEWLSTKNIQLETLLNDRRFEAEELYMNDFNINGILTLDQLSNGKNSDTTIEDQFSVNQFTFKRGNIHLLLKDSLDNYQLSIPSFNLLGNREGSTTDFEIEISESRLFNASKMMSVQSDSIHYTSKNDRLRFENLKIFKPNSNAENGLNLQVPLLDIIQPSKTENTINIDSIFVLEPTMVLLKNKLMSDTKKGINFNIQTVIKDEIPFFKLNHLEIVDADFRSFDTQINWQTRIDLGLKRERKQIHTENINTDIFEIDSIFFAEELNSQVGKERKKQIIKWFKNYKDSLSIHPITLRDEYNVWSDLSSQQDIHLQGVKLHADDLQLYTDHRFTLSELKLDSPYFNWLKINEFYRIGAEDLHLSLQNNSISARNFAYYTTLSKYDYGRVKGYQTDFLNVGSEDLSITNFDFHSFINHRNIFIEQIAFQDLHIYAFRDKTIPFDYNIKDKLFIRQMLDNIPHDVRIGALGANSGQIVYEEYLGDIEKKKATTYYNVDKQLLRKEGIFTLDSIKLAAYNLTNLDSGKYMNINFVGRLMNAGEMEVHLNLLLGDTLQSFTARGAMDEVPLEVFNGLIENLYFLRINSGYLNSANFEFQANKNKAEGIMRMSYEDLELEILKVIFRPKFFNVKKRNVLSWLANEIVVRKDNPRYFHFKEGDIYYERDPKRSVFNYWTKSVLSGMLSTMINKKRVKLNELEKRKN